MTDAREIIAMAVEEKLKIDGFSSYEEMAHPLGPYEVEDARRVVEIANRNEWSAEGDRLARAIGRKA